MHDWCLFSLLTYDKSNRSVAIKEYRHSGIYTQVVILLFCGVWWWWALKPTPDRSNLINWLNVFITVTNVSCIKSPVQHLSLSFARCSHRTMCVDSEYSDISVLLIVLAFGNGESSFFLIMLTASGLCHHVNNGNMRLVSILVHPALHESFCPAVLLFPKKIPVYVLTIKELLIHYSSLCDKLKHSKKYPLLPKLYNLYMFIVWVDGWQFKLKGYFGAYLRYCACLVWTCRGGAAEQHRSRALR